MKWKFIIVFILFIQLQVMSQDKPTLIYIGDPMCSWCYGFSSEISKAKDQLKESTDFQLVMGGLRPYNTETMADLGDFLKEHWDHVEQRTQMPFNYDILGDKDFVYDTEPPSRAVVLMRYIQPDLEFEFFKAVQKAFYAENKNTADLETYLQILKSLGVESSKFKELFNSDQMMNMVKNDFQKSAQMGVRSFPTVLLKYQDKYHVISNGYSEAENIVNQVNKILDK